MSYRTIRHLQSQRLRSTEYDFDSSSDTQTNYFAVGPEILSDDPVTGVTDTDVEILCRQPSQIGKDLIWTKDGIPIVDNDKYDIILNSIGDFNRSILIIKHAQPSDNGEYTCGRPSQFARVEVFVMGELNRFIVECLSMGHKMCKKYHLVLFVFHMYQTDNPVYSTV